MMTIYKNLKPLLWKCESFTQHTTLLNLAMACYMFWMLSLHKENILFIYKRMRTWNQSIDFLFIDYINIKDLLYLPSSLSINSTPLNGETMLSFVSISEMITTFPNYITWIIYSTKLPYWRVVIVRLLENQQNLSIEITYHSCWEMQFEGT